MDNQGTQAPEQLIINGQEYSLEDAARYIDLGKGRAEIEGKLNTSLDKVYPEYTRLTQERKQLEDELAQSKAQLTELSNKQQAPANPDKDSAIKAARELGLVDKGLLTEEGYIRRDDLDKYFSERQTQQKAADNILSEARQLEKEIDGSDGRVPFDADAVLSYTSAKLNSGQNFANLTEAYNTMNSKANARWQEAQIAKEQRPGLTTLKAGGRKVPQETKVTDDNFKEKWDELFGNSE